MSGQPALPDLHLDVHVFATKPADRFVYINMRKYREGSGSRTASRSSAFGATESCSTITDCASCCRASNDRRRFSPMRKILTLTMSGLVTVLPLALTAYVIWWMVHTVEGWLRRALIALKIVEPGALLARSRLDRRILAAARRRQPGERIRRQDPAQILGRFLGRIPFVKTLYGGFRDVVSLLPSGSGEERDLQRVVLARFGGVHAIGFVTREDAPMVLEPYGGRDLVAGYFPMSYAFGGYTAYLPRRAGSTSRYLGRGCDAAGDHGRAHGCGP